MSTHGGMGTERAMDADVPLPRLNFLGCGHLGRALGRLLAEAGLVRLGAVLTRSPASAAAAVSFMGGGVPISGMSEMGPAALFMIATPDREIGAACAALADSGLLAPGTIVFHCSGALSSRELQPARDRGARVASLHPVRSFAVPEQVAIDFAGTHCGIEGDAGAIEVLQPLFEAAGARVFAIATEHKILYHAAAVFASNYTVTLIDVALRAYAKAGVPERDALAMLAPLVSKAMENVFRVGPGRALAGPIARGDIDAALRQQQAVAQWDAETGELYRQLARFTARLAGRPEEPFA